LAASIEKQGMPAAVKGQYFYWHMMLDMVSRKIVGLNCI
jgi:hypothetical protein